jgi:hypothetical protein
MLGFHMRFLPWSRRCATLCGATLFSCAICALAQTNSWTKTTSGDWHEQFWSLGVLPDASQTHIMFTNAGWKALAIDRVTSRDFPDSLNIPRLTVASPTNTVNTLLLNFAGVESPLRVADFLNLGSNAFLLTLSSGIEVGQNFLVDGTVNHGDFSEVSASSLYVGDTAPGVYNFSNGVVSAGNVIVGDGTGGSFHQFGGDLSVTNRLTVGHGDQRTFIEGAGRFELNAGTLTAPTIQIGEPNGRLGPAGADGTFVQSGGSNVAGRLLLGGPNDTTAPNEYVYTLNGGLLTTTNTIVYGGNGNFAQAGGVHRVDGPLAIAGFYGRSFTPFLARYSLSGGVVTARSLHVDFGTMAQSAGANQISGDLVIVATPAFTRSSFYSLSGGILGTSNTIVLNSEHGSFRQSGGTHTVGNLLEIAGTSRATAPGYTLSAGELIAGSIRIRVSTNGSFSQSGGSATAGHLTVEQGDYTLSAGNVAVSNVLLGYSAVGLFQQSGGRLSITGGLSLGASDPRTSARGTGQFVFTGGTLSSPVIHIGAAEGSSGGIPVGADGAFMQSGGSNFVGRVKVGPTETRWGGDFSYGLGGGLLESTNTVVNPYAKFLQAGGLHLVDGPLTVRGTMDRYSTVGSRYYLSNGTVRSRSLSVGPNATFFHYFGTNEVEGDLIVGGDLFLGGSGYNLAGGVLRTANAIVEGSLHNDIAQTGGIHNITGTLILQRPITYYSEQSPVAVRYALDGGQLQVRDIRVSTNAVFRHGAGALSHLGTLTLEGGIWQSAPGEQRLGALTLEVSSTNSSLSLPDSATVLRFANSAAMPWHASAALVIHNWRGSTNGGGSHRIHFGNSASGLTLQQLGRIRFRNPMGLAAGDYAATILNTGEIIPLEPTGRGPAISYQRSPGQLRMEWPSGYTLQTATNILGPFEDLNASSPHIVDTTAGAQRFFRFRQSEAP